MQMYKSAAYCYLGDITLFVKRRVLIACCRLDDVAVLPLLLPFLDINLYSPKNGSNAKTQQYKHKCKQSENNDQVYHTS